MSQPADDDKRREALRKAGEEYFEKILQANKSTIPLTKPEIPPKRVPTGAVAVPIGYQPKGDAEFQAMGNLIERYRDLAVAVIGVSALGAAFALARESLKYLPAPGLFTFLHFAIFSLLIVVLDRSHVFPFELKNINVECARACLPSSAIHGLFVAALFFSLGSNSTAFCLSYCALVGEAIRALLEKFSSGLFRDTRRSLLLFVAALGFAGCFVGQTKINLAGLLCLALLTLALLLEALWEQAANPQSGLESVVGAEMAQAVRALAAREKGIAASNILLMQNLLPTVPLALLAFVLGENKALASSSATVPLVTAALLSLLCYTFGQSVVFYLNEIGTNKRHVSILVYLGFIVGVVVDAVVRQKGAAYLAAGSAALSLLASTLFRILSTAK